VSHVDAKAADTGHFRLTLVPAGKPPEVLEFRAGQTETWLNPPLGEYAMKLDLVSNRQGGAVLASTPPQKLVVTNASPL
jgi:hypothetical protein